MIVNCSFCGAGMTIDEPNGEAYITEADGSIHHVVCPPRETTGELELAREG